MIAPIRIWHQSITDLSLLPGYASGLTATAGRIASPGTVVDVHGVLPGSYPPGISPIIALRSRWNEHLLTTQVVAAALEAEAQGYDAVTVSCFYDPGLLAARDAVRIPVVSACETSLTVSIPLGSDAVLVALDEWQADALTALVAGYGLRDRVRGVVPLVPEITELELEAGVPAAELEERLGAAVARAGGGPATVVVPAEGFLNSEVAKAGIRSLGGRPVVDSFASLLLEAELLIRLGRSTRVGVATTVAAAPPSLQAAAASALVT